MAMQRPALSASAGEFAGLLLAQLELIPRAQVIATQAAALLPGTAINVYAYEAEARYPWSAKASVGDISVDESHGAGTLDALVQRRQPLVFSGSELRREDYAHLSVRRTVVSLAYLPVFHEGELVGAIEAISFDRRLHQDDFGALEELTGLCGLAIAGARAYENERNSNLSSINRLASLYDIEKIFNSTLEMNQLMPIITAKVREMLEAQAVNLWMLDEQERLLLINRDGADNTAPLESVQSSGEGIAAEALDNGKPVLIAKADDARLAKRNEGVAEGRILSLVAVPLVYKEYGIGALEAVNKSDGKPFDEDDVFFLTTVAESAASALHNASLLEAERKIEILETLVEVSQEITSTLNLDRVLQVVVNAPQRIISYDRAAIALEDKGRLQLKAISGKTEIIGSDPAVKQLREMLEWAITADNEVYVSTRAGKVHADREETRTKFFEYFKNSGARAWYSVSLADDQGRLGILSFESRSPDFLNEAHFEIIKVLASQVTVALRNASLYTEVPFIGVLEPLLQKKQQFMRMEKKRRAMVVGLAVSALLFLIIFPLPMRVEGKAAVAPQRTAQIQPELPGVVRAVHVREGQPVKQGAVLAEMEDWEYRTALAAAQAKYNTALAEMNRALANNDGTTAGVQKVQADYWGSEVARARERLERTRLRSPIDGVVATPYVENFVGRKLDVGDAFAQVVDTSHASIDVAVDQDDLPLVRAGDPTSIKLESFPLRKFRGRVMVVSPVSMPESEQRVFFARVEVPNPEGIIRAGMQGQGKVFVGWRASGYVLFRGVGMWIWSKLWSWFGW